MKKTVLAGFGLLLAISFITLNIAVFLFGSAQVFDLTASRKYTLSQPTLDWLSANEKNLYIRLYESADLRQIDPRLEEYSVYVLKLLEQYRQHAKHKLGLQVVRVEPFSLQETEARSLGIRELRTPKSKHPGFLGLIMSDDAGNMVPLPYLNPDRQSSLEQDITRLLSNLDPAQRPDVGILSPAFRVIPSLDAFDHSTPWPVADFLARDYDLTYIDGKTGQIPLHIDVLLVVNPVELSNPTLYAIDQFLLYGGKVIMFVDSLSEYMLSRRLMPPQMLSASYLGDFMKNLGISYAPDLVIADNLNARRVTTREAAFLYPFWLSLRKEAFAPHPIMSGVESLNFNSATRFNTTPVDGIKATVLAVSGANGGEVNNAELSHKTPDQPLKTYQSTAGNYPLAVLLEGKFTSYFKTPYVPAINELPFISISLEEGKILFVADSDMLLSATWNANTSPEQEWYDIVPSSGNLDFLTNAVDYLAGTGTPVAVSKKTDVPKTRSLAESFASAASQKTAAERSQILEKLRQTEEEIRRIAEQMRQNELLPSLNVTRRQEKLERDKLRLQKEQQRADYATAEAYREIVRSFMISNIGIGLFFVLLIAVVHGLIARCIKRRVGGYINE